LHTRKVASKLRLALPLREHKSWSAPELFEDDPKSFSTDVYALGVTLWEVYERRVPFGNMPEAAVVSQILAGQRPKFSASDIPANVKRIIEVCWSASPNERPMADKIAYILTDLWTHHAGRIQEEARETPEGSGKADALSKEQNLPMDHVPSTSGDTGKIVVEMKGEN